MRHAHSTPTRGHPNGFRNPHHYLDADQNTHPHLDPRAGNPNVNTNAHTHRNGDRVRDPECPRHGLGGPKRRFASSSLDGPGGRASTHRLQRLSRLGR